MLKSENLNLNLFEDADYVKPEAFNENSLVLDSLLKNNLCWETGSFAPYDASTVGYVTLEFEKKPMMITVLSNFGMIIAIRDCPHVYNVRNSSGANNSVSAEWTDSSVTLRSSDSLILTGSASTPHYLALLA